MPEITVKLGDQVVFHRRFDGELLRIGRSRENDVVLENLSVSRDHAQLRLNDGQYVLIDLNSANGTQVNGVKITKTEIVDEDVITIGKHKLHFRHKATEDGVDENLGNAAHTVMMEPKAETWLVVESGKLKGREFKITRFETSLGKAPNNDVVLTDDWLLSKKQAVILRQGNSSYSIEDLGGIRKVKVNGNQINDKTDLANGDMVEMGGTKLKFHCSAAPSGPTGRVPKELTAEPVKPPLKKPVAKAPFQPAASGDESLDLISGDDGYQSLRVTIMAQNQVEANPDQGNPPALEPNPIPAEPQKKNSEPIRNNVFEDQRSATKRRRKHQARATPKATPATASPLKKETQPPAGHPAQSLNTDDQEIKIWEDALNNPSPAIKRQAARMLKKLTGRDYDV